MSILEQTLKFFCGGTLQHEEQLLCSLIGFKHNIQIFLMLEENLVLGMPSCYPFAELPTMGFEDGTNISSIHFEMNIWLYERV